MSKRLSLGGAVVIAAALVISVFSGALAETPAGHEFAAALKTFNYNGNVSAVGSIHANKNVSSGGKMYAHKGAQVWGNLLVAPGAIKTDSLDVTNGLNTASAIVTGNLQAGPISGDTLSLTGAATIPGNITSQGKLTATGGIDAGTSAITTTGSLSAGSISTLGTLSAGNTTVTGLSVNGSTTFTGTVNFTN